MKRILLLVVAACGSSDNRAHRTGSAAPVELVAEPVYADGGKAEGQGEEAEPNDTADTATPLALGAALRGKIEPAETDVDRYRIDVTTAGALAVWISAVDANLTLDIEDAGGNVLAHSDRGGARAREGVPNLGVTPGRYTAVVRGKPKAKPGKKTPAPAGPPPVYEITAQVAPVTGGSEREPNDDRGTANDVLVGDHATGFIGWDKDADTWKLSVEALDKTPIDIDASKVDGVALELEVADATGGVLATRKAPRGMPAAIHGLVPTIPPGGAPYYYLTVRGDRSNPEGSYDLTVSTGSLVADAEIEPDDTPDHPFEVAPERTVVHGTWTPGDVDCYLVATGPVPHNVDVVLESKADLDLVLEILADGKPVAKGGKRVTAKVAANARTILRVRGNGAASGKYDLQIKDLGLPDVDKP